MSRSSDRDNTDNRLPAALTSDELLTQVNVAKLNAYYADAQAQRGNVQELGVLWIKTMSILSGGAIVALISLGASGNLKLTEPQNLWVAFVMFACSLVLTMIALFLGYLGQDKFSDVEMAHASRLYADITGASPPKPTKAADDGERLMWAAIVAAFLGLATFAGGATFALLSAAPVTETVESAAERDTVRPG